MRVTGRHALPLPFTCTPTSIVLTFLVLQVDIAPCLQQQLDAVHLAETGSKVQRTAQSKTWERRAR